MKLAQRAVGAEHHLRDRALGIAGVGRQRHARQRRVGVAIRRRGQRDRRLRVDGQRLRLCSLERPSPLHFTRKLNALLPLAGGVIVVEECANAFTGQHPAQHVVLRKDIPHDLDEVEQVEIDDRPIVH